MKKGISKENIWEFYHLNFRKAMKKIKKKLNDEVKRVNEDIYSLRENEFMINSKEKAFKHLEKAIANVKDDNSDFRTYLQVNNFINRHLDDLNLIYQNYKELDFQYKSLSAKNKVYIIISEKQFDISMWVAQTTIKNLKISTIDGMESFKINSLWIWIMIVIVLLLQLLNLIN